MGPSDKIEGWEGMELSSDEQKQLLEGQDAPAKIDTPEEKPPEPEPEKPAEPEIKAEGEREPEPELREPAAAPEDEDDPRNRVERFRAEIKDLPPEELRERLAGLFRQTDGQRGAIARANQRRRDAEGRLESLAGQLDQTLRRVDALETELRTPRTPEAPPVEKVLVERDEEGNYFFGPDGVKKLREVLTPKPPPADPNVEHSNRVARDFQTIASSSPEASATLARLEQARKFLRRGVLMAQQSEGHVVATVEDTQRIVEAYGLDEQLEKHWPGVTFDDLVDLGHGGKLASRIVRDFAKRWFPKGVETDDGVPVPRLRMPGAPAEREPTQRPSPSAPARNALPLANKPRSITQRGGTAPKPDSTMQRFLDAAADDLLRQNPEEVERLSDGAIKEWETTDT